MPPQRGNSGLLKKLPVTYQVVVDLENSFPQFPVCFGHF